MAYYRLSFRFIKSTFIILALLGVVVFQFIYDANRPTGQKAELPRFSSSFVKAFDLGLHAAAAHYYWVSRGIFELPNLKYYGFNRFKEDLEFINELDPRFSFPYYWSVLLLPNMENIYPDAVNAAIAIGERGVREADPDWRVSFYLAVTHYLKKDNRAEAIKYFDLAARAPNAPFYIKRFSENFGIAPSVRGQTKLIWEAIAETSDDPERKERALAYVARLEMFDFLERVALEYESRYGELPNKIEDLVGGGILRALPSDPFGFEFFLYQDGTVGIVK